MKRLVTAVALALALLYLANPVPVRASAIKVFVSIVPQKYFVEKIGGDLVDVSIMVPSGSNPHLYEPKPRQMVKLSQAAAWFTIGVTFEDVWLPRIAASNPNMKIFQSDRGIEKIPMTAGHHHHEGDRNHEEADHHHEGDRDHEEADHHHQEGRLDPHVWTSPLNVKILAKNITNGLIDLDPANRGAYETGLKRFTGELDALDADLRDIFKDKTGFKFMVFHPAWGYLAHDYGLEQIPVEIEGKEPKPARMKELIEHARELGIRMVFVQPQISPKSAETIARAIGGQVAPVDPLAEDWGGNLKYVADRFREALK